MAGGFSLLKKNIKKIDEYLQKQIKNNKNNNIYTYLSKHSLSLLNNSLLKDLRKIAPFGSKNPSPILYLIKSNNKNKIITKNIFFLLLNQVLNLAKGWHLTQSTVK